MSKDELTLDSKGYTFKMILHSGGVKTFIYLDGVIGVICLLFSFAMKSPAPFIFWAAITTVFSGLLVVFAIKPKYWPFFLETNYLFKIVQYQMSLMGDSSGLKKIGPRTEYVQPVIETQGDIITEAKTDHRKAVTPKT